LCQLIEKFDQFEMEGSIFKLTKGKCQALLTAVRSDLKFKYNPEKIDTYAYVCPNDETHVVKLCPMFFKTNDKTPLSQDSKIGTLIHELSHFEDVIGTKDLSVDEYKELFVFKKG
jgi:hypothetical protein